MGKEPEFGTYAYHQPNHAAFVAQGRQTDYVYQSLVHAGNGTHQLSWALTVLEHVPDMPQEVKEDIKSAMDRIQSAKEKLREFSKERGAI